MSFFQGENLSVDVEADLALLKLDVAGRAVNVFTRSVLRDLDTALDRSRAAASAASSGIVPSPQTRPPESSTNRSQQRAASPI